MDSATLAVEWVPLSRLFCSPSNPRLNDPAVPHVAASLLRFGWQQPVVAKPSGEVIAGNTRLKAAQSLGMKQVPVVWFTGTDLEATAFAIADNRTHEFATWNDASLAQLLQQLRAEDALEPTRLFEIPLEQHTKPGDVVLEPFSGSGSQIIAAEKLSRRCRAMELEPAFVDGTILRWEKATGRKATLDGQTYEALAAQRLAPGATEVAP